MRRKKLLNRVWNVLSFLMGTAYSWIILAATVFLVYIFMQRGYLAGFTYAQTSLVDRSDQQMEFEVKTGDTAEDVYARLEKQGIIGSALVFRLENIITSADINYKPGVYTLNPNMKTDEINSILRKDPPNTDITITILEGYSINNIAAYLEDKEIMPADTFIWATYNRAYKYPAILDGVPISRHWLEGYLFPDTYFIPGNMSPSDTADAIINKMLSNFEGKYISKFKDMADAKNLTMNQVITVASILEKDFPRKDERALGAEVIYNRLDKGMDLRMPSTLLYALGEKVRLDRLTQDDVNVDSPYNTYNRPGLPPTPVCNPGEACITAALEPAQEGMLYCILINDSTYEHLFFKTEEEYKAALGQEQNNKVYN